MSAPENILGPTGTPVWSCDASGSTIQTGTATARNITIGPALANPSPPAPGYVKLYSPDGESLVTVDAVGNTATIGLGSQYATVAFGTTTVTGVTAATLLATGITVPAGGWATGQVYHVVAWGQLTTTVDTQTVTFGLNYGGVSGVSLLNFGAQAPNSGTPVTNGAWYAEFTVEATGATTASSGGWDGPDFSPTTVNQNQATGLTTAAAALALIVTPSATAVSVTIQGGYCERKK
jgi:hypothetical protein